MWTVVVAVIRRVSPDQGSIATDFDRLRPMWARDTDSTVRCVGPSFTVTRVQYVSISQHYAPPPILLQLQSLFLAAMAVTGKSPNRPEGLKTGWKVTRQRQLPLYIPIPPDTLLTLSSSWMLELVNASESTPLSRPCSSPTCYYSRFLSGSSATLPCSHRTNCI